MSLPQEKADRLCVEAAENGYIVEIHYAHEIKKMIAWTPRVMIYIIAGLFGYDVQQLELTNHKFDGVKATSETSRGKEKC